MFIAAKHLLGHGQSFGESTHKHTERPHFKSHPKNSGQAPTKSTTAVVKERKLNCWGCGREGHDRKICYFKDHPDFNKEHCSWSDSEKGKSWAAKGKRELRGDGDLLEKRVNLPKFPKKPTGNNDELILCEINTSNGDIQIQALLDTGALDGNYISSRILEYLDKNEIIIQKERHVTLCGAFNNSCKNHIVKDYLINLKFKNELTNKLEILELLVTESDIAFDLIIGRQAIKQKKLAQKIPSHFFSDEDIHAGFGETDHLHPNPSSSTTVCTNCSLIGYQVGNSASTLNLCTINEDKDDVDSNTSETSSESDSDDTPPWSTQNSNDELPLESMIQTKDVELYEDIKAAILQYKHIFSRTLKAEPALVPPVDIEVDELNWYATSNQKAPRMQSIQKQEVLQNNIKQMLELNIIRPSSEGTYSQVHLPPKPGPEKYRFCIDFINLNKACKSHGWPIPNITLALQRIGNAKPTIFGKIDLTKAYYQCPLSERCKRFSAFISFMGCFEWNRVAMGLKGAGGYFQQTIALVVLAGLLYIICELYIDDILVYADNRREFVRRLLLIFERMSKHKLLLNPDKCAFGMSEVEYVGHLVSGQGINFTSDKKTKIIDFKQPMFQKDMKSFLVLANYFRDHILHFANITKPLQDMVAHYAPSKALAWDVISIEAFRKCKAAIQACPTLAFVDYSAPIILETDASDYAIGAYLYQVIEGTQRPIHFISKKLNSTQYRWDTPTKEAYAIFYTIRKLGYLLRDVQFTLRTDHKNLTFLKSSTDSKVYRWNVELQEFDYNIEYIKGVDNVVADAFSRICSIRPVHSLYENDNIPREKYQIISRYHNSHIGHHGVDRTLEKLKQDNQSWEHMRSHVRVFIKKYCPCCLKMSYLKPPIEAIPYTLASFDPMERLSVDTIGPLPPDERGNQYIIVVIDNFSRFIELYSVPDAGAENAAKALINHFGRYGAPEKIFSDNGTQYANQIVNELTKLVGSEHCLTTAYSHEENGIVERANKEVMRHLRSIIFDKNIFVEWAIFLPLVQRIMNSEVHRSTGVSPAQIIFGRAIDINRRVFKTPDLVENQETSFSRYLANMLIRQKAIIEIAQRNQLKIDQMHIRAKNNIRPTEFPINSYVLVEYPEGRPPTKFHPRKRGPLKVLSYLGRRYTLFNLVTNKEEVHDISKLSAFSYDDSTIDPRLIANKDYQVFDVESILQHTGNDKKTSTLDFLVKWRGMDDEFNRWLPWKELHNNAILHKYLFDHNLKRLIPKEHRKEIY